MASYADDTTEAVNIIYQLIKLNPVFTERDPDEHYDPYDVAFNMERYARRDWGRKSGPMAYEFYFPNGHMIEISMGGFYTYTINRLNRTEKELQELGVLPS